jgi:hypothetical protein
MTDAGEPSWQPLKPSLRGVRTPASKADIGRVLGTTDQRLIERVAAVEATYVEVLEAYLFLVGDEELEVSIGRPSGRVAHVIALLEQAQILQGMHDD